MTPGMMFECGNKLGWRGRAEFLREQAPHLIFQFHGRWPECNQTNGGTIRLTTAEFDEHISTNWWVAVNLDLEVEEGL